MGEGESRDRKGGGGGNGWLGGREGGGGGRAWQKMIKREGNKTEKKAEEKRGGRTEHGIKTWQYCRNKSQPNQKYV